MVARLLMTDHRLPRSMVKTRSVSRDHASLLLLFYPLELRLR